MKHYFIKIHKYTDGYHDPEEIFILERDCDYSINTLISVYINSEDDFNWNNEDSCWENDSVVINLEEVTEIAPEHVEIISLYLPKHSLSADEINNFLKKVEYNPTLEELLAPLSEDRLLRLP